MNRFVTPRALGLAALAVVLVAVMVVMGLWQLDVYDDQRRADTQARIEGAPARLADVLGPDDAFPASGVGRPVTVTGTYVADEQIYVRGLEGADATYGVTTPLRTAEGSLILVVRGASADRSAPPPTGTVTVQGLLEPSTSTGSALDADRVTTGLRISSLVEGFGSDLYGGYVVLRDSRPAERLDPVTPPVPEPSALAGIKNLMYALQWWVFAAFVVFMWWRMVNDADEWAVADAPASPGTASQSCERADPDVATAEGRDNRTSARADPDVPTATNSRANQTASPPTPPTP